MADQQHRERTWVLVPFCVVSVESGFLVFLVPWCGAIYWSWEGQYLWSLVAGASHLASGCDSGLKAPGLRRAPGVDQATQRRVAVGWCLC